MKLLLFAVLLILPAANALVISEVMYDPIDCDDSDCEWVEIANNETYALNVSGWNFNSHPIETFTLGPGEFAVLARQLIDDSDSDNESFEMRWGDADGNWNASEAQENFTAVGVSMVLLNNGTTLNLSNSTEKFLLSYDGSIARNGKTLCDINGTFVECIPTPGFANLLYSNETNRTQTNETNQTGNETDECDISIGVEADEIYQQGTVNYDIVLSNDNCTEQTVWYEYGIYDAFGNAAKDPFNTTVNVSCQKSVSRSWTPDTIIGTETYFIRASILNTTCSDTNAANDFASKMIVVNGTTPSATSYVTITQVSVGSDGAIKYGETGEAELEVYKGDTSMTAVELYVEDSGTKISDITHFNALSKWTLYKVALPLHMKPNCNGEYADGTKTLVVKGLNASATATVVVSGRSPSACKTVAVATGSSGGGSGGSILVKNDIAFIDNYREILRPGEEFETAVVINNTGATKNFTIYSYVFTGNNPVSMGFSDERGRMMNTYDANKQVIEMAARSSREVRMNNMIEESAAPGAYSLRVRIKYDSSTVDLTKAVTIVANENTAIDAESITAPSPENTTPANLTVAELVPAFVDDNPPPATGFAFQMPDFGALRAIRIISPLRLLLSVLFN